MKKFKKKVLVGMSGGVDSSVAALLLKRAGFEVVGGHMKCWESDAPECTGPEDEKLARLTASALGIPFFVFDFRKEYKKKVFEYFLRELKKGKTPNPDAICNRYIKFGLFSKKARKLGFDYIATGHYVRLWRGKLLMGKDKNKDQSYFLALIQRDVLDKVLFPLGNYTKEQVREIAQKAKLPTAYRKDSYGICFVGQVKMENFLKEYLSYKSGFIVDTIGKKIGQHQGLWFYTLGQRKGISLPGGPYFVLKKDIKNNTLVVTKEETDLFKKELTVKKINWLSEKPPTLPIKVRVKIRYGSESVPAVLTSNLKQKKYHVKFAKSQRAITPGQLVAFYKRQELLGGGVIT